MMCIDDFIQLITSLLMVKIVDEQYEFNLATYARAQLEKAKREKERRLREQGEKRIEREL